MPIQDASRLKALFKLLQTESEDYGSVLKRELAAAIAEDPAQVEEVLTEEYHTQAPLGVLHSLEEICWENLATPMARFAAKINPDVEEGLTLLSKFTSPTCARGEIAAPLDAMARYLRPILLHARNLPELAKMLSHYFFQVRKIQVVQLPTDLRDFSFARLLRKNRGSTLCVACLYQTVGTRYGLTMGIIDLAGRVLVKLTDDARQESLYIDPLDSGKTLSEEDCKRYIAARQLAWVPEFLTPLSSHLVVRRLAANMIFALNKIHDERRLTYLRAYVEILKN